MAWNDPGLIERKTLMDAISRMPTWDSPSHPEYAELDEVESIVARQPIVRDAVSHRVSVPFGRVTIDECRDCRCLLTDTWMYCPQCGQNVRK